jgi:hypothetical protein
MTLTDDINRLGREIDGLRAEILKNPQGRYFRALEARERDYGKLVIKRAMIELARPLPARKLPNSVARVDMTADQRAWLEGRAPAPVYLDKPAELAAMRELYWRIDATGEGVPAADKATH